MIVWVENKERQREGELEVRNLGLHFEAATTQELRPFNLMLYFNKG